MNEKALMKQLEREGFGHTFVWQDGPNTSYCDYTHETETAHIILSGEMSLTINRRTQVYRAGDRCNVPSETVHSARMGSKGCRYVIGERSIKKESAGPA